MNKTTRLLPVILTAWVLVACGGDDDKVQFTRVVTFGDSGDDVGAYAVGTIAELGGGKFTINGPDGLVWTEVLAAKVGAQAQCAAQTGLRPNNGLTGAPVQDFPDCFNYAQGGSRVNSSGTGPAGVALQTAFAAQNIGMMTISLLEQFHNHLAKVGGRFDSTDLVTVQGGGNDGFMQLFAVDLAAGGGSPARATATVAGWPQATIDAVVLGGADAVDAARVAAVTTMGRMGADLAAHINSFIIDKGAKYVLVRNLANPNLNPYGRSRDAETQALRAAMHQAFNRELKAGLSNSSGVLPYGVIIHDNYEQSEAVAADPAKFGLTDSTSPACGPNALNGSAIVCNASNLIPGDTSRYTYADFVHPTPYVHRLDAEHAMSLMVAAGWQ